MPAIKSAKKKLRQDKKRQLSNLKIKDALKAAIKAAKANPSDKTVKEAFSAADKAAKHFIVHKNKAARIKASLSKLLPKTDGAKKAEVKPAAKTPEAPKKKVTKKTPAKKSA